MTASGVVIALVCFICSIIASIRSVSSQECQSETYNFRQYYNSTHFLDLTTPPNVTIAQFTVSNTHSAETTDDYLGVKVEGDQLIFFTTEKFSLYEELEVTLNIQLVISFTCTTGILTGVYHQNLLEANNHVPKFNRSRYDVTVPLPLPKNFDLSPFIDNGAGIVAVDYDLVNNTVDFTIEQNSYLWVESVKINYKSFRGVLRFKEQILKLPGALEFDIFGTDRGVPPKYSTAKVVITPDLTIEYNDPPAFKKTFFMEEFNAQEGNAIVVELIPGTVHNSVQFDLAGEDASYFELNVEDDKSKATVSMKTDAMPPNDKFFLSVIVEATRSELQKAECVILIDLKKALPNESNVTVVEKTLSIIHLEEEIVHDQVFPSKLKSCSYEIVHELPKGTTKIFRVDESTGWIRSSKFDREDTELFKDVDPPQFQLVLLLKCPSSGGAAVNPPIFDTDIPYSADVTYLNVVVDDINDHSPEFTLPLENDVFAFPVAQLSELLLPSKLLQVTAQDLDAGLNAIIKFSITDNDHFGIDSRTGIVYPLKSALANEEPTELEIRATDRNGADDGNVSKLKIRVVPAFTYQLSLLQLENVNEQQLAETIEMIQSKCKIVIRTIAGGYTSLGERKNGQTYSNIVQRLIVAAFDEAQELISSEQFANAIESFPEISVSGLEGLRDSNNIPDNLLKDDCIVYPYIVVMAVFIVLFIASCALCAYFWFKWRLLATCLESQEQSIHSDNELVENPYNNAGCTPPAQRKSLDDATVDYSTDSISRTNRLKRSLSDMMIIDEDDEDIVEPTAPSGESPTAETKQRRKSIRFSENVERIEVF